MTRRSSRPVLGLALCAACLACRTPSVRGAAPDDPPAGAKSTPAGEIPLSERRAPYDPTVTAKTVEFWEQRVKADPKGAIGFRTLAAAYLNRMRETGDIQDAVLAEKAAREALRLQPRGNVVVLSKLARALLGQHRFPEALKLADQAAEIDPQQHRLRADILLELGKYDEADAALAKAPPSTEEPDDPNYNALQARIAEIHGHPDKALELMQAARRMVDEMPDTPSESVAWYHTMIGHALIDSGKLEAGEKSCKDALAIFPRDYRAMTGMAEAASWRGDWKEAIAWGEKAIAIAPQNPEALKLLGEAHAALGEREEADRQFAALDKLAHSFPRIYDRHWALFLADKGRDLDEALAVARKDLELRQDVHGYDTLAWACLKKGLIPEAEAAMTKALALGTKEAPLLQHAGEIALAAGDRDRGERLLAEARALNPYLAKAAPADPPAGK